MSTFKKSYLIEPNYSNLTSQKLQDLKSIRPKEVSRFNFQVFNRAKHKKLLVLVSAVAIILCGIECKKPNTVLAQEVSATWAETMTLILILNSYGTISLGLEETGIENEIDIRKYELIFSNSLAAIILVGTIDNEELTLNRQGVLSGDIGTEDLIWPGSWLKSFGDESITANDIRTLDLAGTPTYTTFDFQQSGFSSIENWNGAITAELKSQIGESLVPGWPGVRTGLGIGGTLSSITANIQTDFLASGNSIGSSLTYRGDAQTYELRLDDSNFSVWGKYTCEQEKNCRETKIPESSSPFAF